MTLLWLDSAFKRQDNAFGLMQTRLDHQVVYFRPFLLLVNHGRLCTVWLHKMF